MNIFTKVFDIQYSLTRSFCSGLGHPTARNRAVHSSLSKIHTHSPKAVEYLVDFPDLLSGLESFMSV